MMKKAWLESDPDAASFALLVRKRYPAKYDESKPEIPLDQLADAFRYQASGARIFASWASSETPCFAWRVC
jgi:hypothetical protein